MLSRQHVVTYGISTAATATIALAVLLQPWRAAQVNDPVVVPQLAAKRAVDVVFAVDTTGSMGGLLDGAKRTVWSIATHIRKTDPDAELRIGLVAYRDIGDDYVTRDFALSGDLDAVFTELSGYQAAGGGDDPEDVAAALYDVVYKMQWRPGAKKLVFLVGDAPPADRGDVPPYTELAQAAGDQQIIVNAIRCGGDRNTEVAWKQIAALGRGQFSTIDQNGGVQQMATPYDEKLSAISTTIDSTAVIVGDDADRAAYDRKMAVTAAAPAPAKADRGAYYVGKRGPRDSNDLVGNVAQGTTTIEATPAAALPPELRGLDKPALKAEVTKRIAARKKAEAEMAKLAKQRDEYLEVNSKAGAASFDTKVNATIDAELKR